MIAGANIISGKVSVASVNRAGGSEPFRRRFRGSSPLRVKHETYESNI